MDYYLKAESEEDMWDALTAANLTTVYEGKKYAKGISLDIIGTIYVGNGNMIEANNPDTGSFTYEEQVAIDGFHANIRGELTEEQIALLPLIDKPSTPVRVWFGD